MAKHNPRIIIEVRGGVVQSVYSDTANVSVAVLDYDKIATEDATLNSLNWKPKQRECWESFNQQIASKIAGVVRHTIYCSLL